MNEHNFVIAALVALAHAYEPVGAPTLQRVLTRLHAHLHARIGMPVDLHTVTARLLIAALEARPGDAGRLDLAAFAPPGLRGRQAGRPHAQAGHATRGAARGNAALMLEYMGRENMEDYNADFLTMLNSWEAAVKFSGAIPQKIKDIEIARVLG